MAKKIVGDSNARLSAATEQATAIVASAQKKMDEANHKMSEVISRTAEQDARKIGLDRRAEEAIVALAKATAAKGRYDALTAKVIAVIKQFGEISADSQAADAPEA
jgi:hypothetical protein